MRGWFFYYKHQAPGHALFTTLCCNITLPLASMGRDLTSCSLFMSVTHPLVPKVSMSLGTLQIIKWSTLSSTHSLWVHCPTRVPVWSPHHSAQGLAWKALSPSWNPWPPGEGAWKDKCSTFQFSIIRKRHWGRGEGRKRENLSEVFFYTFHKGFFFVFQNSLPVLSNITPLSCLPCCGAPKLGWSFPDSLLTNSYSSVKTLLK